MTLSFLKEGVNNECTHSKIENQFLLISVKNQKVYCLMIFLN